MRPLAITDANIFIDLILSDSLAALFLLDLEIITTNEVLSELEDEQAETLRRYHQQGELTVANLNPIDHQEIKTLNLNKGLSQSDQSIIYVAITRDGMVLTGDNLMRRTCELFELKVHGSLWLLDQWVIMGICSQEEACKKLRTWMQQNRRLPVQGCTERIQVWCNGDQP